MSNVAATLADSAAIFHHHQPSAGIHLYALLPQTALHKWGLSEQVVIKQNHMLSSCACPVHVFKDCTDLEADGLTTISVG